MRPPPRPTLLALATLLVLALGLAIVFGSTANHAARGPSSSSSSTPAGSAQTGGFDGAPLPPTPARGFTLIDQHGRRVSLSGYRGQVLILTFLSTAQAGASGLIAQQIRGALDDLGRPVPALAVSAAPAADSPARVRAFLNSVSLGGRMEYLTGTPAQLAPVWRAYRVVANPTSRAAFERFASVLLIDPAGDERVEFGVEQLSPEGLAHDVEKLRAEPSH
jgi:protein SCO1/2